MHICCCWTNKHGASLGILAGVKINIQKLNTKCNYLFKLVKCQSPTVNKLFNSRRSGYEMLAVVLKRERKIKTKRSKRDDENEEWTRIFIYWDWDWEGKKHHKVLLQSTEQKWVRNRFKLSSFILFLLLLGRMQFISRLVQTVRIVEMAW